MSLNLAKQVDFRRDFTFKFRTNRQGRGLMVFQYTLNHLVSSGKFDTDQALLTIKKDGIGLLGTGDGEIVDAYMGGQSRAVKNHFGYIFSC